jgi:hypothetical protein
MNASFLYTLNVTTDKGADPLSGELVNVPRD